MMSGTAVGSRGGVAAWVVLVALGFSGGCGGSDAERARFAQLTASCSINSDCDAPLVCAFGRCHEECGSNRDCIGRANCVLADAKKKSGLRVCQLEAEVVCNRDGDCSGAQTCAADGECRDGCAKASECAEEQVCVKGDEVCADTNELSVSGVLLLDRGITTFVNFVAVCPDGGPCPSGSGGNAGSGGDMTTGGSAGSGGTPSTGATAATGGTLAMLMVDDPCERGSQCPSGVCDQVCLPPTCSDGVQNGSELDVDCGGGCLTRCKTGTACTNRLDCESGRCVDNVCTPAACPSETGVAQMMALPSGLCIDRTEVTRSQYTAWLAQLPDVADQRADCANNLDFTPDTACNNSACLGGNCGQLPQTCVDFCDALAYCAGVGKRLCRGVDPSATSYDPYSVASEWFYACSSAGTFTRSYGNNDDLTQCRSDSCLRDVASVETCHSSVAGFEEVYDLTDGVEEWEDNCRESQGRVCWRRGGACNWNTAAPSCDYGLERSIESFDMALGFRCCAD